MTLPFTRIEPSRRFQGVSEQIEKAIIDGHFQPGDSLPSEMKLKTLFHTSRSSVREALRILEEKGLIEIRVGGGGGAFVKDMTTEKITAALTLLLRYQKVSMDHVAQFRMGVEGIVAELAAQHTTENDIATLRKLLRQIEALKDRKEEGFWEEFVRLDIAFHIAVTDIARNPVYTAVLQMVHQYMLGDPGQFTPKSKDLLRQNIADLRQVFTAVENRDMAAAGRAAREHVQRFRKHVE